VISATGALPRKPARCQAAAGLEAPGRRTPPSLARRRRRPGLSGLEWGGGIRATAGGLRWDDAGAQGPARPMAWRRWTRGWIRRPGGEPSRSRAPTLQVRLSPPAGCSWSRCCALVCSGSSAGHDPAEINRPHHRQPAEPKTSQSAPITNPAAAVFRNATAQSRPLDRGLGLKAWRREARSRACQLHRPTPRGQRLAYRPGDPSRCRRCPCAPVTKKSDVHP